MAPLRQRLRRPLKPKRYRTTHLLPSLLTSATVACGLLAIIYCMDGAPELAAWMILVAFVCDGLDGKVAKMLKVSSPLGVQLDSLGDVIAFGVAPAMMLRTVLYPSSHKLGISLALIYVLCTVLRLARYNVMAESARKPHFTGLPCPAAAGLLASIILVLRLYESFPRRSIADGYSHPDRNRLYPDGESCTVPGFGSPISGAAESL